MFSTLDSYSRKSSDKENLIKFSISFLTLQVLQFFFFCPKALTTSRTIPGHNMSARIRNAMMRDVLLHARSTKISVSIKIPDT